MSYSLLSDLTTLGISAAAMSGVSAAAQQASLDAAKDVIDGYLRAQFVLPLVAWGADIKRAECRLAAYDILVVRGLDPEKGPDAVVISRYHETLDWLKLIAEGKVTPNVTDSAPGAGAGIKADGPRVTTSSQRGWSSRGGVPGSGGGFIGD